MNIKFLKALNGDAILFSFKEGGKNRNILIDGGMSATYSQKGKKGKLEYGELGSLIEILRKQNEIIDLLILTHVDDDHIGGILRWFKEDKNALDLIGNVWFNSGRLIKEVLETNPEAEYDNSIEFDSGH